MLKEHLMTVQELYDFAKKHGFENATIWMPTDANCYSSVAYTEIDILSNEDENEKKRVYLVYNS